MLFLFLCATVSTQEAFSTARLSHRRNSWCSFSNRPFGVYAELKCSRGVNVSIGKLRLKQTQAAN